MVCKPQLFGHSFVKKAVFKLGDLDVSAAESGAADDDGDDRATSAEAATGKLLMRVAAGKLGWLTYKCWVGTAQQRDDLVQHVHTYQADLREQEEAHERRVAGMDAGAQRVKAGTSFDTMVKMGAGRELRSSCS